MKRVLTAIGAVVVVAVAFGLVLKQNSDTQESAKSDAPQAAQAKVAAVEYSPGLPQFTGKLLDGSSFSSSQIAGPAVIKVFASWCPTCQGEAADFAAVQKKVPGISYYYLNVADEPADAEAFLAEHGWKSAPVISDKNRKIAGKFSLTGQPHTVFIGADETVRIIRGPGSRADLLASAQAIV